MMCSRNVAVDESLKTVSVFLVLLQIPSSNAYFLDHNAAQAVSQEDDWTFLRLGQTSF